MKWDIPVGSQGLVLLLCVLGLKKGNALFIYLLEPLEIYLI